MSIWNSISLRLSRVLVYDTYRLHVCRPIYISTTFLNKVFLWWTVFRSSFWVQFMKIILPTFPFDSVSVGYPSNLFCILTNSCFVWHFYDKHICRPTVCEKMQNMLTGREDKIINAMTWKSCHQQAFRIHLEFKLPWQPLNWNKLL